MLLKGAKNIIMFKIKRLVFRFKVLGIGTGNHFSEQMLLKEYDN